MANQISSCLVYTNCDPEYSEAGWVLDLADSFYPIAVGADRTARVCFHDAFEHGDEWRGTLANEVVALGRMYVNRVGCTVSIDSLSEEIKSLLCYFDGCVTDGFDDTLDQEFPECSNVGTWDQLYGLITEAVVGHAFLYCAPASEDLEALISRIYGLMAYGADSALAFWGSIQNARQGSARAIEALSIMSTPSLLLEAMGVPNVTEFFWGFELLDEFPVVLNLDNTGIVTFEQCYESRLIISEIQDQMEDWED